ncbi:alpha-N-acetylglucosaminidase TIM-barrel domain-containing protein [Luteipulveratus mongoliensis]|uniref:Alpha-N-acetylglucosaminidase n=1 Tax=Luteipulveratus mongoliensis TaxID=571913 RepID=A0A0K1JFA6_9MICO|nr:alpha-N-acetylglucosaminidase TIM-barrel domain-containing protein [Luteipulveratus mongoliensis]AKU15407.1 hypothetical protein VV02_05215 [Luteipulveratus mongoliensis]
MSSRLGWLLTVFALLGAMLLPMSGARAAASPAGGTSAAERAASAVLQRTIGKPAAAQVVFLVRPDDRPEAFTIGGRHGRVTVSANSSSAALMGAGWYLKYVVHADVNLGNLHPRVPHVMPAPGAPIRQQANARNRFALNDTHDGYTDPNMSWAGWQQRIDLLALHGINQVFISTGMESVYAQLFQKYGYSAAEMRAWIPQPAHQPWWLLQNMSSDQKPLSQAQIDGRAKVGRQITDRLHQLGMTPVLPGYFGTVPIDFQDRNPSSKVVPQGDWVGYQRPGWLDPTNLVFAKVAADFYRISTEVYGASTGYKMDPLHEGGKPGDVNVTAAATAIETALRQAHPTATWVLLGWQSNPSAALQAGIKDKSRMLIVDGLSDRYSTWDRDTAWPGAPYAFGSIYNFGGHTTMGANMQVWLDRYYTQLARPGSQMDGIAVMPEGFDSNPVAFELLAELAWQPTKFDLTTWLKSYALGRYGTSAAASAWVTLSKTAYSTPADDWSESQDSIFNAQPSLTANTAASWSPGRMRYDGAAFERSLPQLLAAAPSATQPKAYEYDLTDLTRQALDNRGRVLLPQIKKAYDQRDSKTFNALTTRWMSTLGLLDQVTGTSPDFLLGTHVKAAEDAGSTPAESATLRQDFLSIITVWGNRAGFDAGLGDYANRELQGLISTYYAPRWRTYFSSLQTSLSTGKPPAAIDWYAIGDAWTKAPHRFPTTPTGDIRKVAATALSSLRSDPYTTTAALSASSPTVAPGASVTVTATFNNANGLRAQRVGEATLRLPTGLSAKATSPTSVGELEPGTSATVTWSVSISDPDALTGVRAPVTLSAAAGSQPLSATVDLLAGSSPQAPWATAKSTDATMVQAGDALGISASGADMWGSTLQYGSAYQRGVVHDGSAVAVRVDSQQSAAARPWARSGIVIAGDLSTAQSPGLVDLAVTPANGCVLSWGSGATGTLNTFRQVTGVSAPVWLRLTRKGATYVGECSTDGQTWQTVGTATPGGVGADADAGVFSSAANSGATDRVTATFSGWSVVG